MIEILDKTTDTCVVARFGGKVSGKEYNMFLDAVDKRLQGRETVNMVADLSGFEFYGDFEAFKEDWHFGTHEYRKVGRAAFVGDQKWIGWFIKMTEHIYRAEEKHFPAGQLEEACAWACRD